MGDDMNRILTTHLTLNGPIPDKVKKLSQIFIFTLLCGASKGFMKVCKTFFVTLLLWYPKRFYEGLLGLHETF